VHEYASGLTSISKAELLCSCKSRKFIGQNKVKFVNYEIKIFGLAVATHTPVVLEICKLFHTLPVT